MRSVWALGTLLGLLYALHMHAYVAALKDQNALLRELNVSALVTYRKVQTANEACVETLQLARSRLGLMHVTHPEALGMGGGE